MSSGEAEWEWRAHSGAAKVALGTEILSRYARLSVDAEDADFAGVLQFP